MLTLFKGWWNISNIATNICSYGEKSLDGSFSKLAVQQMGHLPLFLCSLTHFTKAKRYLWEPGFSCCLFLWLYLNAVPHYEAPIQLLKCTAFLPELL